MGGDPTRQTPFFFQKPADALVADGGVVPYPSRTRDFHHEVELVVAIGAQADCVSVEQALSVVFGYAVGLDMTRRDLQAEAKKAGRPWDMAKGFDYSAPCGTITRAGEVGAMTRGAIWVRVDDAVRQSSDLSELIWSVPEIIAELSTYVTLMPGDLIFTGTPDKVGPVERGARLHAHVDGLSDLRVTVV